MIHTVKREGSMAGRIVWVGLAGLALVTGMVLQDGDELFSLAGDSEISARTERAIDRAVDRSVDRGVERMQVIGSDGRELDVPPEMKRAFADAVGRLVKAEADLAIVKIRDGGVGELQAAQARRDAARAEVEGMKAALRQQEQASAAVEQRVESQVRDEIRTTIREAVRN